MAGAVWTEVWNMQPVRNLREKGGFAALVGSANVAGWLGGTRVMGDSYGAKNRKRLEGTIEILEVLSMHLDCEPFGAEWVYWIPTERNAAADSLATRAIEKREDAFFLSSRWHTDKWSTANVVTMSDAGIRDSPRRPRVKQQGMGFLMVHWGTRELLAAASFYEETRAKQDDINILETEGGAGSSTKDDGSTSRRGRTVHEHTSKRIHTTRTQDAQKPKWQRAHTVGRKETDEIIWIK